MGIAPLEQVDRHARDHAVRGVGRRAGHDDAFGAQLRAVETRLRGDRPGGAGIGPEGAR